MQTSVPRQDFNGGPDQENHSLTSSGRAEWTLEGSPQELYIDLDKQTHLQWLQGWCKAHWISTFRRSLVYNNKLTYHRCCNSFSRRGFAKQACHPPILSAGILQIPKLRNADSHKDLYEWQLELIEVAKAEGNKVLFPSLNRFHLELHEQEEEVSQELHRPVTLLTKRNNELEKELEKTKQQLQDLRKDNDRLQMSSKSWFEKYDSLLDHGQTMITIWSTPKKHRVTDCSEFLAD